MSSSRRGATGRAWSAAPEGEPAADRRRRAAAGAGRCAAAPRRAAGATRTPSCRGAHCAVGPSRRSAGWKGRGRAWRGTGSSARCRAASRSPSRRRRLPRRGARAPRRRRDGRRRRAPAVPPGAANRPAPSVVAADQGPRVGACRGAATLVGAGEVAVEQQLEDTEVLGALDQGRLQRSPHEEAVADADLRRRRGSRRSPRRSARRPGGRRSRVSPTASTSPGLSIRRLMSRARCSPGESLHLERSPEGSQGSC